jgi:hypothetical protein
VRVGEEESRLVPVRFPRRNAMHTVIRRYEGVGDTAEVARRAVEEFGPMLADRPGFQGYWAIDAGDGVAATITVFDTEEQATESIAAAAGWVSENMADLVPNPPQITAGVTTGVMAEAPA